ncbi:MAG: CHAT domain-containing protein [Geitlerinemataceae cyanobacterium]
MSSEFVEHLELSEAAEAAVARANAEEDINAETVEAVQVELTAAQEATGTIPAMVYVFVEADRLSLIVVPPDGQAFYQSVEVSEEELVEATRNLQNSLINVRLRRGDAHKIPGGQLYDWLIAPIRADLDRLGIDTLVFALDRGFRGLPLAALYNGERYLVEDFAIGLIPSINLVDFTPSNLRDAPVLAMGASEFEDLAALPAVPTELETIANLTQGRSFTNAEFTLDNTLAQRADYPAPILHLATHAEFSPGALENSYIQLWDGKLTLDRMRELSLSDPPVEMMVLSACRTAVGDDNAELGFAGIAVQSGVKSVVASLWYVSDAGTLSLMSQLYSNIRTEPTRSQALRHTQLAMLRGEVTIEDGRIIGPDGEIPIPAELEQAVYDLSHPYFWAAFTTIGSPW